MPRPLDRRSFLAGFSGLGLAALAGPAPAARRRAFEISLAQWSLHRMLRSGELSNLDFARFAKERFGIAAVEYVNQFFMGKATDFDYLERMKRNAEDAGVKSLLIMIDAEGQLADPDDARRARAVESHYKWAVAAAYLGCHSIRVNAGGSGGYDEQMRRAAESLRRLADFGAQYGVSVIVENHGGLSSNGKWLAGVMELADHPGVGTLPDFGNFHIANGEWYDRYEGVAELMPWAKAVSAKSHEFDEAGNEVRTNYRRMLKIVVDAGYAGHVGIEYEGDRPGEVEGIELTRKLLERVRDELG